MTDDLAHVGPRLRAARQAKGLTLEEVAGRSAMSVSTLSRLESGKRQATLELLVPLTRQLGMSLDDLVRSETSDPRVRRAAVKRHGLIVAPLALEDSPVSTYKVTFPPVADLPDLRVHDGFEWLYVLSGKLRLRVGTQDLILGRGEAAEFDTRTPHALSASGSRAAEVISIFNAAGVRLHTHGLDETGNEGEASVPADGL
ncbi:helix-turn-helix domain-containing protein [Microbacterium sp. SLBN-146]|uniref:helix-turn-helix domain-containing protein n=1 Tax=Microbacterium sp. SLBN-146 TaxID=2768457 RepID=UPI001150B4A2|nr:XRE family transcriptional regulator [Microbacterium sp. SLBN-146]TQJ31283.1 XRE family transcriptional regulator [Microbacterium sp. SLBN-146]